MAIEDWMGELQEVLEEISGIEAVYTYENLPGTLMTFPCLVVMPLRGSQDYGASAPAVAIHQVQITLYMTNQVLPEAMTAAVPYIALLRNQLAANVTLRGTVNYILPPLPAENFYEGPGSVKYGDKDHTAIIFSVRVKDVETITVTP